MAFPRPLDSIYQPHTIVLAQSRVDKNIDDDNEQQQTIDDDAYYAYFPARIIGVQATTVFCKWIDPDKIWSAEPVQISKKNVVEFKEEHIEIIKTTQFIKQSQNALKAWEKCINAAKKQLKEKVENDQNKNCQVNQLCLQFND